MGFERKFKDGDKVRVKDSNNSCYKKIGTIKWYGYPLYVENPFYQRKIYYVDFGNCAAEFNSHQLEKVEDSNNITTNTKSTKLSISDLKPGMKVRIKPDLKEGRSTVIYVYKDMENFAGTIVTIKGMLNNISDKYNCIYLENIPYAWDIDCFSEIVKESEEEITTSEKIKLPLKEGQVVTLLDGKEYKVMPYEGYKNWACEKCSLFINDCSCKIAHLNGTTSCTQVINSRKNYFKLLDSCSQDISKKATSSIISNFKIEKDNANESIDSSNSVEESSIKEIGIITKVNFTLTDFKSEELVHSKFTIL